jgi:hypothetical protein
MSLNTFDRAKLKQHFQPAMARPACRSCIQASGALQPSGYRCMKGGFFVTAYAICDAFERKPSPDQQLSPLITPGTGAASQG